MALTMPNLESISHEWRRNAACREVESHVFFPIGATGNALLKIAEAKKVCNGCDSRAACLDFALMTNQDSGVWGGLSEEERRNIRRRRAALKKQQRAREQELAAS